MDMQLMFKERSPEYFVLDFEGFREEVIEELLEVCGNEFLVEKRDVMKNNGVTLSGISITGPGETVFPTIYLEALFDEYRKGKMNIKEIVNEILRIYTKEKNVCGVNMSYLTDFDSVREKLIYRLINAEKNESLLKDIPHRRFLDLAVIYTVYIDDVFNSAGNVTVRNDLMEKWGVDEEELYILATRNTPRIKKPVIKELGEMLAELMDTGECRDSAEDIFGEGMVKMFVLTNCDRYYGDSIILYPGLLKDLRDMMKTDLYLLPSSVHEFIIVPASGGIGSSELSDLVKSVNESSVVAEDFLSDNIYLYKNDTLDICS
ncbi:MAG: hypothetical protein IJU87_08980 [Lachnospiraceae bacterium]|nr:hypothetical protein [Lachnospiraceae bacterium]